MDRFATESTGPGRTVLALVATKMDPRLVSPDQTSKGAYTSAEVARMDDLVPRPYTHSAKRTCIYDNV